jgi:ABC-type branched-subunit amino acid transport system ATPase component/ABC-type branched-subunit amino acid transport system permease subunit
MASRLSLLEGDRRLQAGTMTALTSGLILGLIFGLLTGMLAVGLVLVYKASRFVNLAHGQLGALSALLLATLVLDHGWNWWIAFPLVVAVGAITGFGVERLIIRRLRHQQRRAITYLLVTIGVGQVLLSLTFVPALAPDESTLYRLSYPLPFNVHYSVGGADLTAAHIMILVLVPLVVAGLALFLRYSALGKSIRAAASNPESARLCGISVDRVNAVTWVIAGVLSAVTAILIAPGQTAFSAAALGPGLLLRSLGAAALGGFVSIPAALVGGVSIGVIEQVILATTERGSTAELSVFITVMLVLLVRGRTISAADDGDDVAESRPRTRVPPAVASRFIVRSHRLVLGAAGLVVAAVVPLIPYFHPESKRFYLVVIVVMAIVGVALTMLLGWVGQVSLGHFAIVGLGAFVAAKVGSQGRSLIVVLLVAGVLGAIAMTIVGYPALRLRGMSLAVTTLGFAVAAPAWLFSQEWLLPRDQVVARVPDLGVAGVGKLHTQANVYYAGLVVLVLVAVGASALQRSGPGRLIVAARDNDRALSSLGFTPATVKLAALAASGFVAAMAGVIWGIAWDNISPGLVQPAQSLAVLAIPVVGGLGSVAGAIAGAVLIYAPAFFLGPSLTGIFGDFGENAGFQLILGGLGLVFIPLMYPMGLAGVAQTQWERLLRVLQHSVARWQRETNLPPLHVSGVNVEFGGIKALQDVSIQVRQGEIVGLIGPNGAGKTTLVNVIGGQITPTSGAVLVAGQDVSNFAPEIRSAYGLGRSYQDARLFPGLTVAEVVQVALTRSRRVGVISSTLQAPWARRVERETRREALDLLTTMGLTDWANTLTSDLSTGLRRMTDLAIQIAARSKVLLLDEPTAGVAQREGEAFGPVLRRIRDELDCSILIIEHDMPLLMGLCDRIYAMETGRILAEGTPEEIRNDPAVIASYLGTENVAIERSGRRSTKAATATGRPRRSKAITSA